MTFSFCSTPGLTGLSTDLLSTITENLLRSSRDIKSHQPLGKLWDLLGQSERHPSSGAVQDQEVTRNNLSDLAIKDWDQLSLRCRSTQICQSEVPEMKMM